MLATLSFVWLALINHQSSALASNFNRYTASSPITVSLARASCQVRWQIKSFDIYRHSRHGIAWHGLWIWIPTPPKKQAISPTSKIEAYNFQICINFISVDCAHANIHRYWASKKIWLKCRKILVAQLVARLVSQTGQPDKTIYMCQSEN